MGREAQKVEGLRSALAALSAVLKGKSPELDEPSLVGMQVQSEASESFLYGVQNRGGPTRGGPLRAGIEGSRIATETAFAGPLNIVTARFTG